MIEKSVNFVRKIYVERKNRINNIETILNRKLYFFLTLVSLLRGITFIKLNH